MGGALLRGWLRSNLSFHKITVISPRQNALPEEALKSDTVEWIAADDINGQKIKLSLLTDGSPQPKGTDTKRIIVLAVKPAIMADVIKRYQSFIHQDDIVTSVAAGLPLAYYEQLLSTRLGSRFDIRQPIVRIMPNTPSTIQKGVSLLVANHSCSDTDKKAVETLVTAVGDVMWTSSDDELDRLTAISGCGPAFVFAFAKAMEQAAISLGCTPQKALFLSEKTLLGSALYLDSVHAEAREAAHESSQDTLETLMRAVASPGGMTEKGLDILRKNHHLDKLMQDATRAAYERAVTLNAQINKESKNHE